MNMVNHVGVALHSSPHPQSIAGNVFPLAYSAVFLFYQLLLLFDLDVIKAVPLALYNNSALFMNIEVHES